MKIAEMQEKQRELDNYIAELKGYKDPYAAKYRDETMLALKVEIGEMCNATRCFKRWSLKGPEPKIIILDELADILHFLLKMFNFDNYTYIYEFMDNVEVDEYMSARTLVQLFNRAYLDVVMEDWNELYKDIVTICKKMGYVKIEIEEAYEKKLKENYLRQKNGY